METEEKIDARKLSPRELSEKRRIAMKLRDKGMPNKEVAQIVGISAQTISSYYTQYKKMAIKYLLSKMLVVLKNQEKDYLINKSNIL
jgi:predicted transcriptional regulator